MKRLGYTFPPALDKGIALIELMIIVVLVSTIATAYWNFHIMRDAEPEDISGARTADSSITAALDEIGYYLRQARPDTTEEIGALRIEHADGSDRIYVRYNNEVYSYYVDNRGNLVRRIDSNCTRMAGNIVSLKAFGMGSQTVVITISARDDDDSTSTENGFRSFSRVINSIVLAKTIARP